MTDIKVAVDTRALDRLGNAFKAAGKDAPVALAWGVNATGRKALTQMRRALVAQTGMRYGVFVRALKAKNATGSNGEFRITSKGGNVRLMFFKPRETRAGVTAAPWNKRTLFAGSFMTGGRWPNRTPLRMGKGKVFERVGRKRLKIREARSDLYIPDEMVTGASRTAFDSVVASDLPRQVERALYAILSGVSVSARARR